MSKSHQLTSNSASSALLSLFSYPKGSVVFVITDSEEKYFLDLRSEDPTAGKGGDLPSGAAPDLTVRVSEANMIAMITKKLNPQQAFMKGKLKIKGKMPLAMKLTTVLAATAKKLPQSKL